MSRGRLAAALVLMPMAALAQDAGAARIGNHPGFGRVVFEFASPTGFQQSGDSDKVVLTFDGAPAVTSPAALPRNVRSVLGGAGTATLLLLPGARARAAQIGNRVVIDVLDPPAVRPPRPPAAKPPEPAKPTPPIAAADPPAVAPVTPVQQEVLADPAKPAALPPASAPAVVAEAPPAARGSVLIPLEPGIGAAALRRGGIAVIVFDSPAALDEASLRRVRGFEEASVQPGAAATAVYIPLASGGISLVREAKGWRLSPAEPSGPPVDSVASAAGLAFGLAQPGRVVTITDPATGGTLLIGTANPATGQPGRLALGGTAPSASVLATWAGVAVEPFSDDVVLRPTAKGFTLATPGASPAMPPPAPVFTQRFDFPNLPVPALMQRLQAAAAGAAAAAPRARTPGRIAVAQAMLALGMAAEAQGVLSLAAGDDPAAASNPDVVGLSAIAALLAGRMDDTGGLASPSLDGRDDVVLWRGVRDAVLGHAAGPASTLPPLLPLAAGYPMPLRDRVLPVVAETAVLAGHPAAATLPDMPRLGFARALQLERGGQVDAALAAYDALAAGRDQLDQVRGGAGAVELRLATGQVTPAQAADALRRLLPTWRGDGREAATRMRVAELQAQAGAFRPALDLLRETEALFPDARPAIRARMATVFAAVLTAGDATSPLDFVVLAADYADLVPPGPPGAALARLLTDKLLALDLPARARPVLETRVAAAPPGPVRAGLGHRLASLQLDAAEAAAAERTLAASDAPGLPERLQAERAMLLAKARAAQGDLAGATAGLSALATPAADDLRARLLESARDWRGALAALNDLTAKVIPPSGPVAGAAADLVLRQASAAVQAGDAALLHDLNTRYANRLAGPRAELFQVLTAAPVGGVGDLPRAAKEVALARAVPGRLGEMASQ